MENSHALVPRKYLLPFVLVTSLFAFWGFANDITNPMVSAFKKVLELDNFKASWVQFAFYFGYFTMALPAAMFARKYSYKKSIIIGLALYACGALLFFPAAALESFGFFLLSLYILTFGLAFLETTASPYIMTLGSEKTATQRLNLAQAFNPIGALGGLIVAKQFIVSRLEVEQLGEDTISYGMAGLVIFLAGRWVGTFLLRYFSGGRLLFLYAVGASVMTLLAIFIPGFTGLYAVLGIYFFMSVMFPTIYGISLEGQGEDAKFGAAFLVMAIVGGALMPPLQGLILDQGGKGLKDVLILGVPEINFSFVLPLLCFVVVGLYGLRVSGYRVGESGSE